MERLEDDHLDSRIVLRAEHRHRYMWATDYASGDVCDLACGYGYGSEILTASPRVASYVGIDASAKAVEHSRYRFSAEGRRFICASAPGIPLPDHSVDTVVSIETLEHIVEPQDALREFRRVMRQGAILVGSVPSKHFDDRCEAVYGANPYHVQRFTHERLFDLLRQFFPTVCLQYSALEIVSHIGNLVDGRPERIETVTWVDGSDAGVVNGSLHFIATDRNKVDVDPTHCNRIQLCQGFTEFEAAQVVPLRRAFEEAERLIAVKDEHLTTTAELLRQKDEHLTTTAELLRQKDEHLATAAELLRQKDEHLATAAELIRQRDELLAEANARLAQSIYLPWRKKP